MFNALFRQFYIQFFNKILRTKTCFKMWRIAQFQSKKPNNLIEQTVNSTDIKRSVLLKNPFQYGTGLQRFFFQFLLSLAASFLQGKFF